MTHILQYIILPSLVASKASEEAPNVLLYLVRGELPSSTRGQGKGEGLLHISVSQNACNT